MVTNTKIQLLNSLLKSLETTLSLLKASKTMALSQITEELIKIENARMQNKIMVYQALALAKEEAKEYGNVQKQGQLDKHVSDRLTQGGAAMVSAGANQS
jgi:hypothetical protein